jgi:vacuolar-type H+-ATPase subunit F/Vma7
MPRVIVIGRRADILPFKAAGAELIEVRDGAEAGAALGGLRESVEPVLVMMTEDMTEMCGAEITVFRENRTNVLLPIPTINSAPGKRLGEMRSLIARALGVDLLGRKETGDEGKVTE